MRPFHRFEFAFPNLRLHPWITLLILLCAACRSTPQAIPAPRSPTPTTKAPSQTATVPPSVTSTSTATPTKEPATPTATPQPTQTASPSRTTSPTTTPTATAATLAEAVQHLDSPEKLSAFLVNEISFADHGGCLSYWPDVFYQKREGNCKDYSTFASYVLAQHGYPARRVVFTYYRGGVRFGHEVAAYEIAGETWIMSNGYISGPFDSLMDYFQSLASVDYVTLLCIKPPGGVSCCNP